MRIIFVIYARGSFSCAVGKFVFVSTTILDWIERSRTGEELRKLSKHTSFRFGVTCAWFVCATGSSGVSQLNYRL